ncbi:unnamed protein product [Rotaria sordida]|uniref:HAT C-terminal dimerisation domain-containing protein n=1 Tax=Rotaria sordida TaxID=392033 RepID=A0A819Y4N4_9BILA|nr:unnamed protein product [Rotaria sordida]
MSSDLTETSSASSIVISDTTSSDNADLATKYVAKTVQATCKICKSTIRGTKGVTSNYNRHIKEFHKSQYELWQQQLQFNISPGQKKITDTLTVQKVKPASTSGAMYLSNHPRQVELEKSITEDIIIELGLPISIVERSGFIKFMFNVDPRFKMISRRTLNRTTLPNLYSKMLDGLKSFCSMATFMSLTLDLWTDRRQRAFFALTDNQLNSDWNSDDEQIESNDITSENNTSIEAQDILKQLFDTISSENESFRLPCYAHTLQLTVKDGLKGLTGIQSSLEKISKIAKLSHSSTLVSERFEKIQICIPKANITRWNSQYETVVTVTSIQPSDLNEILIQTQHRDLCLKPLDYQMLSEFVSLLALFAEATIATQAQNIPSISIVAPSILAIYHDLLLEQSNTKYASSLCECLLESLLSRFGGLLEQMLIDINITEKNKNKRFYDLYKDLIYLLAPFLDGHFRLRWISSSLLSEQVQEELSNKIQQLVFEQCILLKHVNGLPATSANDNIVTSPPIQTQPLFNSTASSPSTPKRKNEISKYLKDNDMDSMLLLNSSNNYPTLSKLALKILSIPATSGPVERVFSQSGFLFRQHRASMTRTTLQQLTMLKCNRDLL